MAGALEKINNLLSLPAFSAEEARKCGVSHNSLSWYVRTGRLNKLGAGFYYSPTHELDVEPQWEELIRIMSAVPHGVVCLGTALSLFDLSQDFIRTFSIAIPNEMRAPQIQGATFIRMRNMELGKTFKTLGAYRVPIFDLERTLVDSLRLLSHETGLKALKKAWKHGDKIDLNKIGMYADELHIDVTSYVLAVTA